MTGKVYLEMRKSFTLIEVALAILVFSVGALSIFALFPLGLRQSKENVADTQAALFADYVFGALEGRAFAVTNWDDWIASDFDTELVDGLYPLEDKFSDTAVGEGTIFPEGAADDSRVRYEFDIEPSGDGRRKKCRLKVARGRLGSFDSEAEYFYSELIYMGM